MIRSLSLIAAIVGVFVGQPAHAQESIIKKVKSENVLRVGIAESPPFAIKNPATNTWQGFNVDMANDLAESLGVKLEIVDASWPTLINGLTAGQYDIVMASTFATPARAQSVLFTDSYIVAGELVVVHRESPYKTYEDLNKAGVVFSVLGGTTNEQTARRVFPNAETRILVSENQVAPVLEVASRRADANIGDQNSLRRFVKSNPQAPVRILDNTKPLNQGRRAYAIRPTDFHFLNFLNNWIEAQKLSGRIDALLAKWELI